MNSEIQQVINFLSDRHDAKDGLIKNLMDEVDRLKKELAAAMLPPEPDKKGTE